MDGQSLRASARRALRLGGGILALAFALSFVVNLLRLSGPVFMILVYDRVLPSRSEETLVALFVMLAVFLLSQVLVDYGRKRILARFGAQFQERVETALFAASSQSDMFEAGRLKPAAGLDEVDGLRAFFHSSSLIAIFDFFWVPMFVTAVFILDPAMGWICLAGAVVLLVLVLLQMALQGGREADSAAATRSILGLKLMMQTSRPTIRAQNMTRGFKARWLASRADSRDKAIRFKDWTVWFDGMADLVVQLTRYGVLAMGAFLVLDGSLTVGAMVAATFLVSRVLTPIDRFMRELPNIVSAFGNWSALKRILVSRAEARAETMAAEEPGNPRLRLSVQGLTLRAAMDGRSLLKGIDLDLAPGELVQVIGAPGRGKTVLAEALIGLHRKTGGRVLVNGLPLARLSDEDTARLIGFLPEAPSFVAGTLAENIASLDPSATPARVAAAARRACLHAAISALPEGYETEIDTSASPLSRLMRMQLGLARALYAEPEILILDDPDPALHQGFPKTIEKSFGQILDRGGCILLLARQPWALARTAATYDLTDGRLVPRKPALPVMMAPKDPKVSILDPAKPPKAQEKSLGKSLGTAP